MPVTSTEEKPIQLTLEDFIKTHEPQLRSSGVPEHLWKSLFIKLAGQVYDAGSSFQILCEEIEDEDGDIVGQEWKVVVINDNGIQLSDYNNIFLIDHAWTFRVPEARGYLEQVPGLRGRMANLMDIDQEDKDTEVIIEEILKEMWRFNQTFSFGHYEFGAEESLPFWYIMDEFGSRVQYSDEPTFKMEPFYFCHQQMAYTLMWPVGDCDKGDEVTRNYVENTSDPLVRQAKLLPWKPIDMTDVDCTQEEPDEAFFMSNRVNENLPNLSAESPTLPKDRSIKVFMEYANLAKHLTDPRFEIVHDEEEADILWLNKHYKDFKGLSEEKPNVFINQFPQEFIITVKDMLAVVSRRAATEQEKTQKISPGPKWLPVTYNLVTELPKFVSYYQQREALGLDNHWICKPWNLARSMDMHITKEISTIARLADSGPKVVCKYIHNPVLFNRQDIGNVKFDFRYMVLLADTQPLKIYAYHVFWLRFANRPYSLDHFEEYEKHFTVMNYDENVVLKQVHYDEFIPMFNEQYPDHPWAGIEQEVFQMIRELFTAATSLPPPRGIPPSPQSRSMYALDLMLSWETNEKGERYMQPQICEVNYSPDCDRACKYHPFFVNDVFSTLFLDDIQDKHVTLL
ncbi:tubulin--tyrosine ligase-like protein 12 isoform X1 [Patella vulgata]|uniref:tubulin--tyrosine ligase-like protein 12 isoform X1 n=1 Tax=Patella vulgata TaxID=6465 RepID=UPI0024A7FAD0|nr:tubulin--tyrosine ligase-like protein 12 isoform X1 [Patella vulgata]